MSVAESTVKLTVELTNHLNVTMETTTKDQSFPRQPTNLATSKTQSPTHYTKPKQDKTVEFSIESFSGGFAVGVAVTIIVICIAFYIHYKFVGCLGKLWSLVVVSIVTLRWLVYCSLVTLV
jgi:hypothetical protein